MSLVVRLIDPPAARPSRRRSRASALALLVGCACTPGPAVPSASPGAAGPAESAESASATATASMLRAPVVTGTDAETVLPPGDTFVEAARRHGVAFDALVAANPDVDPFRPGGARVVVPMRRLVPPGAREGLIVNLPELTLYRFDAAGRVETFPIGAGRVGDETPVAEARIVSIDTDPTWYPPASIRAEHAAAGRALPRAVAPGPDNPLGRHALRLDLPGYLLHGTDAPDGVGMRVSHGCIRLYPEDIERLAGEVMPGTRVRIVDEPVKWALDGEVLLLEAHRPFAVEGRDGGAMLRSRFAALRAELRARGASVERFDAALSSLHADGRLFTGRVLELRLDG